MNVACFVVQSCLADADFVVFSNYCLIGTRLREAFFICRKLRRDRAIGRGQKSVSSSEEKRLSLMENSESRWVRP